jgi:Rieske Fe-S protein
MRRIAPTISTIRSSTTDAGFAGVALRGPGRGWDGPGVSTDDQGPGISRRAVIAAAAGIGAATACGATNACGRTAEPAQATGTAGTPAAEPAGRAAPTAAPAPAPLPRSPRPVAATTDIPVGGGRVYPELRVVVTQPSAGEFRGFGIVCTHDQCELNSVAGGTINCPCHGSRFALTDGSVVRGPALTGLRKEKLAVDGGRILLL